MLYSSCKRVEKNLQLDALHTAYNHSLTIHISRQVKQITFPSIRNVKQTNLENLQIFVFAPPQLRLL